MSATPIPVNADHFVQFYEDDDFLVGEVSNFIGRGLSLGEAGIVIATRAHRESLEQHLWSQPAEGRSANGHGPYLAFDAAETLSRFMVDGRPDSERFTEVIGGILRLASDGGTRRVRAFGEMVALLWAEGNHEAAVRLEELWNGMARKHSFSLYCAYPLHAFNREEYGRSFLSICTEHARVFPAESCHAPADPDHLHRTLAELQHRTVALETEGERRRKTERELSDFLEHAVEGLHRAGPDGTILWANRAELEMLGYSPEEYIGHHVSEFHVERETVDDMLGKLLCGERLLDYPARLRCKDHAIRHVLIHADAYFENGRFAYTRCFTRDITDRMRFDEERTLRLEQLAEIDRRKDEFLAMLGHELRNPLAPISNALHILGAGLPDDPKLQWAKAVLERQVRQLTRLVNDLLDISRINCGSIELQPETLELAAVVETAVETGRPVIESLGHRFTLDMPDRSIRIRADRVRLGQVFANILNNAAKYTKAPGLIHLSAGRDSRHAVVSVRDNGIGIPKDMLPRIFEMFTQADASPQLARGGLGVGLALAKQLVQMHGGTIEASSAGRGCGSEFTVRLPFVASVVPSSEHALGTANK